MRERLIALLKSRGVTNNPLKFVTKELAEHLADYLLANGVIVPPCKLGDIVYKVEADKRFKHPTEHKVIGIWCAADERCNDVHLARVINGFLVSSIFVPIDEFGKTLFLTREEAENALAERRNRDAE